MSSVNSIVLSALSTYQRALATTSHNISNAQTEGYSRQQLRLESIAPAGGLVGNGVAVQSVLRSGDEYQRQNVRQISSEYHALQTRSDWLSQLQNIVAESNRGVNASLGQLETALQEISSSPESATARNQFLTDLSDIASSFQRMDQQLNDVATGVDVSMRSSVVRINQLADDIATLNIQIARSEAATGNEAGDLRDQRDQAMEGLSELIDFKSVEQSDGSQSIFIGDGYALVLSGETQPLSIAADPFQDQRSMIVMGEGISAVQVDRGLRGGELGALLQFRNEDLDQARTELGYIAVTLTEQMNQQHRAGLDANGDRGGDLWRGVNASIQAGANNSGTAQIQLEIADASALEPRDYQLRFDGSDWLVLDRTSLQPVSESLDFDGLSVSVTGAAEAGDEFRLSLAYGAAAQLTLNISNPDKLAFSADAVIESAPEGLEQGLKLQGLDPAGMISNDAVSVAFDSPTQYRIDGGVPQTVSENGEISVQGRVWSLQFQPEGGESFVLASAGKAIGDNHNVLQMLTQLDSLNQHSAISLGEAMVSGVAGELSSVQAYRDSEQQLLMQAESSLNSTSGVNLDEEAANLLRYQQAYQAAARAMSMANGLFDDLLNALR